MAAKTLSDIRGIVRQSLRDEFKTAEDYAFEEDELDIYIAECLTQISMKQPYEMKETVVSDGTKEVDISSIADLLDIEKAEYPTGGDPPNYRDVSVFGNTATLGIDQAPASGQNVYLYCQKVHQLTESSSTLNPRLENVLVEGAVAKAATAYINVIRDNIDVVGQIPRYQAWANNALAIYMNSLNTLTKPRVWEFYPRG
jgi:hypothetical protein